MGRPAAVELQAGDRLGDFTIIQKVRTAPNSPGGQKYRVQCVCGTRETLPRFYLMRKKAPKRHCGCKRVKADEPYTKRSWNMMHQRCEYKKHVAYKDYGGRGIKICQRWHKTNPKGWENFKKDMGPRPFGLTLDRENPNGHYEPSNCRWATPKTQRNNQRQHHDGPDTVLPLTPEDIEVGDYDD